MISIIMFMMVIVLPIHDDLPYYDVQRDINVLVDHDDVQDYDLYDVKNDVHYVHDYIHSDYFYQDYDYVVCIDGFP